MGGGAADPSAAPTNRPGSLEPAAPRGASRRRPGPGAVVKAGLGTLAVSAAVALLPLLLGRWDVNRYLVAFGFVGGCVGASILLHGVWDWLSGTPTHGPDAERTRHDR